MNDKQKDIVVGCVCYLKVDDYKVLWRVEEILPCGKKAKCRLTHPNRDVNMTLPIVGLIYQGANFIDYQNNYSTTNRN